MEKGWGGLSGLVRQAEPRAQTLGRGRLVRGSPNRKIVADAFLNLYMVFGFTIFVLGFDCDSAEEPCEGGMKKQPGHHRLDDVRALNVRTVDGEDGF